ncbi:MAG: type VI secretion system tip protein VgrG [Pirellula sp.]|jgi:type VI secretion system secreted protein VgrG|nr:type VI secretion system tip protein VgrG [Pirellula sp.]
MTSVKLKTPLADDVLIFHQMQCFQTLSKPFEITLDLLSKNPKVDLSSLLGKPIGVRFAFDDGPKRYFHGHVSRFSQLEPFQDYARYQAHLVPWLWFLTKRADCRIFQEQSVPEIVKSIFEDHNASSMVDDRLSDSYKPKTYCVQYRESDFEFVSRLLESEGIYYFFEHFESNHKLVLSDALSSHKTSPGFESILAKSGKSRDAKSVYFDQWFASQEVSIGSYALSDFDFERPKTDLSAKKNANKAFSPADKEWFDFPGRYLDAESGASYATKRLQEFQVNSQRAIGQGSICGLQAGLLFKLTDHPRNDQNQEYLIVESQEYIASGNHQAEEVQGIASWNCSASVMPSKIPFRPPRLTRKPIMLGPQTAIVVGKKDEEIWTDKFGRVKVRFHWDRLSKSDEKSSCWIRVSQAWAGNSWGTIHIPRIGQEVVVSFLEGDPDQPIITGSVYNADQNPPYPLPDSQTQSGIKSQSTKGANSKNFNELRFEDKKDAELIYLHAERDFERVVENNDSLKVGFDKKTDGDQVISIHNNQTITIGNKDSKVGSQTITIWKDRLETLETGDYKLVVQKGMRSVEISKGNDQLTLGEGNRIVDIKKGNRQTEIKGDDKLTLASGAQTIKISSGGQTVEAATFILLKVGGSSIKIEPACITIKSVAIKIQGDAKVDISAPLTSCKGDGMLTLKGGMTMIN